MVAFSRKDFTFWTEEISSSNLATKFLPRNKNFHLNFGALLVLSNLTKVRQNSNFKEFLFLGRKFVAELEDEFSSVQKLKSFREKATFKNRQKAQTMYC